MKCWLFQQLDRQWTFAIPNTSAVQGHNLTSQLQSCNGSHVLQALRPSNVQGMLAGSGSLFFNKSTTTVYGVNHQNILPGSWRASHIKTQVPVGTHKSCNFIHFAYLNLCFQKSVVNYMKCMCHLIAPEHVTFSNQFISRVNPRRFRRTLESCWTSPQFPHVCIAPLW